MKNIFFNKFLLLFLLTIPATNFAQHGNINQYSNIRYEYKNHHPSNNENNPLIICVPGFTQHNRSREFLILKDFFDKNGFSYLIMNPPQHGEDYTWFKKLYTWGEKEVKDLHELTGFLKLWDNHSEIHLLGFSIGAKIVLKFSAESKHKESIKSVVAVAAPFRVADINMRVSGDVKKIPEGLISSFHAMKRAGFFRILHMIFFGLPKGLFFNKPTPANEISHITAPTLLLHGADDWLTKSYHSVLLFEQAENTKHVSLVVFNTRTHAEDMLSRDGTQLKMSFLETLNKWFAYVKRQTNPINKIYFNDKFNKKLTTNSDIKHSLYRSDRITLMSSPTINELNSNIWISAADHNHSVFTINSAFKLNDNTFSRYFFTVGSTKMPGSLLDRIRLGLSFEKESFNKSSAFEGYFSINNPLGSIVWLRRITFIQGIGNSFNRWLLSADIALLVLDFQLNYGEFLKNEKKWQLAFNFPLIGNASGSYYFGVGYSKFFSSVSNSFFKNDLKAYLVLGPAIPIFRSRFRATLQYEQNGFNPSGAERIWSAGLSINYREK